MSPRSASKVIVTASEETTIMDNATLSDLNRRQPFEPEMILIPAGEFLMGSDPSVDKDTIVDEQPQHHLYLPDFYIAKTPTTNAQYAAFVLSADHEALSHWEDRRPLQGQEDHFVVNVSWYDAVAYCNWLSDVTGKAYRLPSEAEWEKAARGTDGRIYPWGNEYDISLFWRFSPTLEKPAHVAFWRWPATFGSGRGACTRTILTTQRMDGKISKRTAPARCAAGGSSLRSSPARHAASAG